MSDTIVVMNEGRILQIGTPEDIYNEPKNSFVANFIGESNILSGVMKKDFLVHFAGADFKCVDTGFGENSSVDIVIRPEDVEIVAPDKGALKGIVENVIFKGVHYEMRVQAQDSVWKIHSTKQSDVGESVGLNIEPHLIHVMEAGK